MKFSCEFSQNSYKDNQYITYFLDALNRTTAYNNWGTNSQGLTQPDNRLDADGNKQHCVSVNYRMAGLWDDFWCYEK